MIFNAFVIRPPFRQLIHCIGLPAYICIYTGELGYDGLNGTKNISPSYAKSVIYI